MIHQNDALKYFVSWCLHTVFFDPKINQSEVKSQKFILMQKVNFKIKISYFLTENHQEKSLIFDPQERHIVMVMDNQEDFPDWQCCNETFIKMTSISRNVTLDFLVSALKMFFFLAMHYQLGTWGLFKGSPSNFLGMICKCHCQKSLGKKAYKKSASEDRNPII